MRVKQLIMKILIASLAMTAVVGLPRGQVKPKTMSLSARQTIQTHAAQKTIALFQQMAVFPDGSQRPLAGGVLLFTVLTYGTEAISHEKWAVAAYWQSADN